uniref:Uncharacterized protein n=1 Tax=Coturnix japonica TaxID=93934 RepID=A0A8C2TMW7_COTJA
MAGAYFPVGPGLGPEENFLSLDDILMSQEKLPSRAESNLPRMAFALGQGTGAEGYYVFEHWFSSLWDKWTQFIWYLTMCHAS